MIEVRRAETDADLEAWIQVRRAVLPNESAGTVEYMRSLESPDRTLLLAELNGELLGSGLVDRSSNKERALVQPRVMPDKRRRGVGTVLLREGARLAEGLDVQSASAHVEGDLAGAAFAQRYGFDEIDRQVEQVIELSGGFPDPKPMPDGVEVVSIAERPELLEQSYALATEGYEDLAIPYTIHVPLDEWLRDEATIPGGSLVALADGEIVGYSGLMEHDNDGAAEDGLTVVRRDWRRRGLARALKERELAWAAANGIREVITWTQTGNDAMRSLNELLGYRYRDVSITVLAPLPLKAFA